jgi:hypothetical protein
VRQRINWVKVSGVCSRLLFFEQDAVRARPLAYSFLMFVNDMRLDLDCVAVVSAFFCSVVE